MNRQSEYFHTISKSELKKIANRGWPNWYINRGRMSKNPTAKEKRAVSWKRVF